MSTWYYTTDGTNQVGPLEDPAMLEAIGNKQVLPEHLVFKIGDSEWRQAKDFPELFAAADPSAPPDLNIPDPFGADLSLSGPETGIAMDNAMGADIALGATPGDELALADLAVADARSAAPEEPAAETPEPAAPESSKTSVTAVSEPKTIHETDPFITRPSSREQAAPPPSESAAQAELPWTVALIQAVNGNWGAEITFSDASNEELKVIRESVKRYASIAFGGLPRIFAGDRPNKFIYNLSSLAFKPEPWLPEGRLLAEDLFAFRDSMIHTVKILHANQLGFWVFDPRMAWRLPEGIKIAAPFWMPAFAGRPGTFPSAPPDWRDGPNVQPSGDTYVIACSCFYAATGSHFDPGHNMLPGAIHPQAEYLDPLLAPALQERPARRPEDLTAWRALWPDQIEAAERKAAEQAASPDETVLLPSSSTAVGMAAGGPVTRHGGGTKRVQRASTVVSGTSKRGKTKREKRQTRKLPDSGKTEGGQDLTPLDRDTLAQLRTDPVFWATLLLGAVPLFAYAVGGGLVTSGVLLLFIALFWGVLFHTQILKGAGGIKQPAGAFLFSGVIGVFGLYALYTFLPRFILDMPSGDLLTGLLGSMLIPGLMEEACKALPVIVYCARRRSLADPATAVAIGVGSGLGFAALKNATCDLLVTPVFGQVVSPARGWIGMGEGLLQGGSATDTTLLLMYSLFFAQAAWSGIAGYFVATGFKSLKKALVPVVCGFALPAFLHGLYNWLSGTQAPAAAAVAAISFLLFYGYFTKASRQTVDAGERPAESPAPDGDPDDEE